MILDAAVEAKLETRILEEWYCRDENAVPPAYYLRPKSEMLKSYQNTVSHSHLLTKFFSHYSGGQFLSVSEVASAALCTPKQLVL